MKPEDTDLCPCCSGKPYGECCKPIMEGEKKAPTAEALMRARYCAYATEHVMFLKESAVKEVQDEFDAEISTNWSRSARWHRLEIVSTEGGGEGDGWKFKDGELVPENPTVREEPKIGRNDPCPCGSGKKYKKCCGKGA